MWQGLSAAALNWTTYSCESRIRHLEETVHLLLTKKEHPVRPQVDSLAPLAGSFRYSMDRGLIPVLSKTTTELLKLTARTSYRNTSSATLASTPQTTQNCSHPDANPSLPSNLVNLTSRKPLKGTYSSVLTQVDSRPLATSRPRPRSFPLPTHGPVLLGAKRTLADSEIRTNHVAISEPDSSVRHPTSSLSALAPPSCPLSPSARITEVNLSPEKNTPCSSVAPGGLASRSDTASACLCVTATVSEPPDPVPISSTDETATSILATSVSQAGINVDQARPPSPPPSASAPHPLLALSSPPDPLIDCPAQTQGRSLPQSRSSDRFPPPQRPKNQPSEGFSVACRDPLAFAPPNISSTQDTSLPASDPRTDVDDSPNEWTSQTRKLPSTPMFSIDPSENDIPNLYLELGYSTLVSEILLSTTCPTTRVCPADFVVADIGSMAVNPDYSEDINNYLDLHGEGETEQTKKKKKKKKKTKIPKPNSIPDDPVLFYV
ncbi:hypothetical protein PSTG_00513 [Puccinia striiformis f. sp. tritici PST-78]|uniref:Uncharacterized protein n=2 Tax=Puccinia striiformis TaxID=27350 RepID=A0A0L0W544_9BASI|nr:hypothetical protein PSTG_00513 [Puccinia striiformis f. sp. tritici PST-78]